MTYQAIIRFTASEDDFEQGIISDADNWWEETLYAATPDKLKTLIEEYTFSSFSDVERDEDDEEDNAQATVYRASYMANEVNMEDAASESEIEEWKAGTRRSWVVECRILVSKVSLSRIEL